MEGSEEEAEGSEEEAEGSEEKVEGSEEEGGASVCVCLRCVCMSVEGPVCA